MLRRLARRLFALTVGVSLVLMLATVALSVRSYWVTDSFNRFTGADVVELRASRGRCLVMFGPAGGSYDFQNPLWWHDAERPPRGVMWYPFGALQVCRSVEFAGFAALSGEGGQGAVGVPLWFVASLAGVLPLLWVRSRHRRRTRQRASGLCAACSYDLRASPDRCPECGAACKAADPAGVSPAAGD